MSYAREEASERESLRRRVAGCDHRSRSAALHPDVLVCLRRLDIRCTASGPVQPGAACNANTLQRVGHLSLKTDAGDCARALPLVVFALIAAVGANAWKNEVAGWWRGC